VAWPIAARAQQQAPRVAVIGFLHPGFPDSGSPAFDALREGLREGGYVEGDNVKLEARWARGRPELLPQLTQELIQLRPAILVATARPSIEAARAATTTIPILANDLESDPVASRYVESLAHPGGNLTGMFLDAPSLCGKWLQHIDSSPGLLGTARRQKSPGDFGGNSWYGLCRCALLRDECIHVALGISDVLQGQ
jgi:putative ABC transport system substrate-binding protein